jgi:lauroyl/myristoyl acyltransferase
VLRLLFGAVRSTGGRLPPRLLLLLLWPPSFARAAADVWLHGRRPPTQLPPIPGVSRRAHQALADRLVYRMTPLAGFWADRALAPGWASRFDLSAIEQLRPILRERPVILVSFHFGALVMVPSLLNQHGMPTALAVSRDGWPLSRLRQWRLDLAKVGDIPTAVVAEARAMLRFLQPGRCLIVAVDYPTADVSEVAYGGATVRLSTPPLRLARVAGALVVPMLAINDGPWRMSLRLGRPVPQATIQAGDYQAAAAHIANELLPLAASVPGQALPTLVEAFLPAAQLPEAPSPAVAPSSA